MGNKAALKRVMPTMLNHEGVWVGEYQHIDLEGHIVDAHSSHIVCEFPDDGPYAYVQYNTFTWPDGQVFKAELPGTLKDGALWWDVDTFHGKAWETTEGLILLHLVRKDLEGGEFFEIIVPGGDGKTRARTWHWFQYGTLFKRTLCNEKRQT
ncbi:MAG: hypothetical protein AAGA36_03650 [Pseudomonadota bacterium]